MGLFPMTICRNAHRGDASEIANYREADIFHGPLLLTNSFCLTLDIANKKKGSPKIVPIWSYFLRQILFNHSLPSAKRGIYPLRRVYLYDIINIADIYTKFNKWKVALKLWFGLVCS